MQRSGIQEEQDDMFTPDRLHCLRDTWSIVFSEFVRQHPSPGLFS
jgi:hypothetical protein